MPYRNTCSVSSQNQHSVYKQNADVADYLALAGLLKRSNPAKNLILLHTDINTGLHIYTQHNTGLMPHRARINADDELNQNNPKFKYFGKQG